MTTEHIGQSIERAIGYLSEHPEEARYTDSSATAVIEGLKSRVESPHGATVVSDMPKDVGEWYAYSHGHEIELPIENVQCGARWFWFPDAARNFPSGDNATEEMKCESSGVKRNPCSSNSITG